jgi:hypothetical protein
MFLFLSLLLLASSLKKNRAIGHRRHHSAFQKRHLAQASRLVREGDGDEEEEGYDDWEGCNEYRQHDQFMDGDIAYAACCLEMEDQFNICPNVEFCKTDQWKDVDLCYKWCRGSYVVGQELEWCSGWLDKDTEVFVECLEKLEVDEFCSHGFNMHGDKLGDIGNCCKSNPKAIMEGEPGCHYWAEACYGILEDEETHIAASISDCSKFCHGKEGDGGWCAEFLGKKAGLSAGAIAGIAIGSVVVVVAITSGIWFCFMRKKYGYTEEVNNPEYTGGA